MNSLRDPHTPGSQLQSKFYTRSEARFLRGLRWFGGCFLIALVTLVIQQVYIARTLAAHIEAGGADDPDAVFGHFDPIVLVAPLVLVICLIGGLVCLAGWLIKKGQRLG